MDQRERWQGKPNFIDLDEGQWWKIGRDVSILLINNAIQTKTAFQVIMSIAGWKYSMEKDRGHRRWMESFLLVQRWR
jgi:hypothetical protein